MPDKKLKKKQKVSNKLTKWRQDEKKKTYLPVCSPKMPDAQTKPRKKFSFVSILLY